MSAGSRPALVLSLLCAGALGAGDGARQSRHFALQQSVGFDSYTGYTGSRRFERSVLEALEAAYERVSDRLALRPRREIRVLVYEGDTFEERFAGRFRFSAAGFYNGALHIRGDASLTENLVRTLHHEYVHAAIDAEIGRGVPAWLNEGLAEYFERLAVGQRLPSRREHAQLRHAATSGAWLPLSSLSGVSFGHLESAHAQLAYLEAYGVKRATES